MVARNNNAGAKAGKPNNPDENKIFGVGAGEQPKNTDKPITNTGNEGGDSVEMTQIPTVAFQEILERLNTLESKEGAVAREEESDIFDPLKAHTGLGNARVSFLYNPDTGANDLVLGYIPRVMTNGTEKDTWVMKDPNTSELRTYCSIKCVDENGVEYERKNIDYITDFLEAIETKECPIVERKDIGQQVKQEFTIQRVWNGKTLVPTNVRVQTGYKEQKFVFVMNVNGKEVKLKQNVINIK